MTPVIGATIVGGIVVILYAVLGGADFGGGVWDLLASGPRRQAQRDAITHAIGPVWEANHVWLIFAVVILFVCFPPAFAEIGIGLYAPLSLALVGIVMRGAAFAFRNYAGDALGFERTWTVVFGIASLITPFFLGTAVGGLATGRFAWSSPFALAVGLFAVVAAAQIAAVFILREIHDVAVQTDFRRRAVRATVAVWIAGVLPAALAAATEPHLFAALERVDSLPPVAIALVAGLVVIAAVARHADLLARAAVAVEAAAIIGGWFGAQAPDLIPGRFTFAGAASSDAMIVAFLIAVGHRPRALARVALPRVQRPRFAPFRMNGGSVAGA